DLQRARERSPGRAGAVRGAGRRRVRAAAHRQGRRASAPRRRGAAPMSTELRAHVRATIGTLALDVAFATTGPLVVVGPNGAGKTSLLEALLGTLRCDHARVALGERVLADHEHGIDVPVEARR